MEQRRKTEQTRDATDSERECELGVEEKEEGKRHLGPLSFLFFPVHDCHRVNSLLDRSQLTPTCSVHFCFFAHLPLFHPFHSVVLAAFFNPFYPFHRFDPSSPLSSLYSSPLLPPLYCPFLFPSLLLPPTCPTPLGTTTGLLGLGVSYLRGPAPFPSEAFFFFRPCLIMAECRPNGLLPCLRRQLPLYPAHNCLR